MNLNEVINNFLQAEEKGNLQEAMMLLQKAQNQFPNESNYLLSEMAELYYRHDCHLESIRVLIKCYRRTKLESIKELLLHRYYQPNSALFQKNFVENCVLLQKYPFFYGDVKKEFANLSEKIIWLDEERVVYLDEGDFQEYYFSPFCLTQLHFKDIVLLSNCVVLEKILQVEKKIKRTEILWYKTPFYLYYEPSFWSILLQMNCLQTLIAVEKAVFLVGEEHLSMFFQDMQAIWPSKIEGEMRKIQPVLDIVQEKRRTDWTICQKELSQYYSENKDEIIFRIKKGQIRILFVTSRFSTAIQYYARDCKFACEELGWETELLIEKSDIHRITDMYVCINAFKPDIIFCIDHFRFEHTLIPPEIIFVTWIQDDMPLISDPLTPKELIDRDFILNAFTNSSLILKADYSQCNEIQALIPCNEKIYHPYCLSSAENEKYNCDICLVCHDSNFSKEVANLVAYFSDDHMKNFINEIAYKYFILLYEEKEKFFSLESCSLFIEKEAKCKKYFINKNDFNYICTNFYVSLGQTALRVILVKWLLEAGYTNIKLWGRGWEEQEEFLPYAMGTAENGEILSKILQSSKINLGNNARLTAPSRAWETIFSKGFYLSNFIDPEFDSVDIRTILQEDKEIKMFYNKKDLFDKINYYLTHEKERTEMIEIAYQKALNTMTYTNLMQKMIREIIKKL